MASATASMNISNDELLSALKAALDSYPGPHNTDFPSSFLHIEGEATEIFAFPGSHNLGDWVTNFEFKQCPLSDVSGLQPHFADVSILVHKGFAERLGIIMQAEKYRKDLDAAVAAKKRIIFTGHSLGGAVATLAALTLLYSQKATDEKSGGKSALDMVCCTFAAPLVGELALGEAVAANGWNKHFITVVARHDIVPRLLLSPAKALTNAKGMLKDGAMRGLQVFLKYVSRRIGDRRTQSSSGRFPITSIPQRLWNKITRKSEPGSADSQGELPSQEDDAALSKMADDVMEGCRKEAAPHPSVGGAIKNLASGALAGGIYRPFGTYVLHTSSGSMMCHNSDEVLQMLYVTMVSQSNAVSTRPLDVIEEHLQGSYEGAVNTIIATNALSAPKWQGLQAVMEDVGSLYQMGMLVAVQSVMQRQETMMTILKRDYERPPEWYEREQAWLVAQDSMDVIYAYKKRHDDAGTDYCAAFKAHTKQEDQDVEKARRVLRVFWDTTVGMYASGRLDVTFFQKSTWLTRATRYMVLVEPIEIANYYRCGNWKSWSVGKRHYLEDTNRPSRFPFFEAQFAQFYPEEKLEPVLHRAREEALAVDRAEQSRQQ